MVPSFLAWTDGQSLKSLVTCDFFVSECCWNDKWSYCYSDYSNWSYCHTYSPSKYNPPYIRSLLFQPTSNSACIFLMIIYLVCRVLLGNYFFWFWNGKAWKDDIICCFWSTCDGNLQYQVSPGGASNPLILLDTPPLLLWSSYVISMDIERQIWFFRFW
jgi:hypothetical protein